MKFIFSCSISISHSFAALTPTWDIRVEHSKINFISPRAHVLFSMSLLSVDIVVWRVSVLHHGIQRKIFHQIMPGKLRLWFIPHDRARQNTSKHSHSFSAAHYYFFLLGVTTWLSYTCDWPFSIAFRYMFAGFSSLRTLSEQRNESWRRMTSMVRR